MCLMLGDTVKIWVFWGDLLLYTCAGIGVLGCRICSPEVLTSRLGQGFCGCKGVHRRRDHKLGILCMAFAGPVELLVMTASVPGRRTNKSVGIKRKFDSNRMLWVGLAPLSRRSCFELKCFLFLTSV